MNGRVDKDKSSNFTCFANRGNSVVDYALLRQENFAIFDKLTVGELCELSDHSPSEVTFKSLTPSNKSETQPEIGLPEMNQTTSHENKRFQKYKKQYYVNDDATFDILSLAMDGREINTFLRDISNHLENDDIIIEDIIELLRNKMIDLSDAHLSSRNVFHKYKNKNNFKPKNYCP